MAHVYSPYSTLNNKEKVDNGECVRLLQVYLPQLGHTSTWRPVERVTDLLERGEKIAPGTAIATFVNGRFPQSGQRHAAFYEGPVTACSYNPRLKRCPLMGIIVLDQWNPNAGGAPRPLIMRRTVRRHGPSSSWSVSDNADAFYIIR